MIWPFASIQGGCCAVQNGAGVRLITVNEKITFTTFRAGTN